MQEAVREFEEAAYGVSKPKVIQMEGDVINDKYNVHNEVDKSKLLAEEKDIEESKRENFLKVYKEENKKKPESDNTLDTNIRFREEDGEDDSSFKLNTRTQPDKKPLITEIGSGPAIVEAPKKIQEVEVPFSWVDA